LVVVFRHVYLVDVVMVDVFHPHHTAYLLQNSVVNTHNSCIILVIVPILHPPLCTNMLTKIDITVDVPDVVENIVGCAVV
jgi:hypothetical protein